MLRLTSVMRHRLSSAKSVLPGVIALGAFVACGELRSGNPAGDPNDPNAVLDGDGGGNPRSDDTPPPDGSAPPPVTGGDAAPSSACRPAVLDCLDPTADDVLEVPSEKTFQEALATAKANDVVQVRGLSIPSGYRIPPYVTLRGCAGAKLVGWVAFKGGAGTVEGFTVTPAGTVYAPETGSYVVRQNRFVGAPGGGQSEPGVSGSSIEAYISAQVNLVVEANVFEDRPLGVEGRTRYDTLTHQVALTVRNNTFRGVARPILLNEAGLVGVIDARIEHNTFYDFETAIDLFDVGRISKTSGNLFVKGTKAISGSPYEVHHSFAWEVTTPAGTPPNAGAFASGDPLLVDPANGDLRLRAGSPAIDAVPSGTPIPGDDLQGCPRPAGAAGSPPRADVGAYENQ